MKAAGQMGENERVARESSFAALSCEGEERECVFRGGVCNYLFLSA